ncbi:ferredoxin [Oleomonas cavernae]|uniref:Ferredoxin n=1 Tax=Oleomonas cavernae TaxID=2320859 RepID=A0A418WGY7_9PROT|nr:ferredoxin [Oleomonas cavernae]RJF89129.1 ferredoxin [Oleomonas cavernae]
MKITVDWDRCKSNGVCVAMAREVFRLNGEELDILQTEPPEDLREKVMRAVKRCPTQAISVEG